MRQSANREIVAKLAEMVEQWPEARFHQILHALEMDESNRDKFYDESVDTLAALKIRIGELK